MKWETFRATGSLWGESPGHQWIPLIKACDWWRRALVFSFMCAWINEWANRPYAGDLICHGVHCDVTLTLHWRHNDHDGVSNHQPHGCLLNRLFRRRSKKTAKLRVTGLCVGNSPGPVNSPHKGPVTRKMFPFDDVIMDVVHIRVSHSALMMPWSAMDIGPHWFRQWLFICSVPNLYMNQCWRVFNWIHLYKTFL